MSATNELAPPPVHDPDIVVPARQKANEDRRRAAQLKDEVLAKVAELHDLHPDASNNDIVRWVKDDRKIRGLVEHLRPRTLADKIGEWRKINRR